MSREVAASSTGVSTPWELNERPVEMSRDPHPRERRRREKDQWERGVVALRLDVRVRKEEGVLLKLSSPADLFPLLGLSFAAHHGDGKSSTSPSHLIS